MFLQKSLRAQILALLGGSLALILITALAASASFPAACRPIAACSRGRWKLPG